MDGAALNVLLQCGLLELFARLLSVMLYKVVDDVLFEAELDGDVLAEYKLALKNVLISKDQVDARHQVFELLLRRQGPERLNRLGIPDQVVNDFFRKMAVARYLKNHLAFNFGKMLVSLCQLNENVQLLLGNDIHREVYLRSKLDINCQFLRF